jgi:hypothetical protein
MRNLREMGFSRAAYGNSKRKEERGKRKEWEAGSVLPRKDSGRGGCGRLGIDTPATVRRGWELLMTDWSSPPGLRDYGADVTNDFLARAKEAELERRAGRLRHRRPAGERGPGRMRRVLRKLVGR